MVASKVTYKEAVALVRSAYNGGIKGPKELGKILSDAGYVSRKTGGPITGHSAYCMALYGKTRAYRKRRVKGAPIYNAAMASHHDDRIPLVKRILTTKSMDAEDRIELALLALGE